ncbi:hypothetical protein SKAU_G00156950 [Synaphobranchus kaupii]|uniref:Uncharacterized protein n=1 Tax=Synaphobranchus kaupii TaxID=118154 RepID=A0A9Q1FHS2_SYNKA|nr:hypothetical protein SKAU_G00156950 [Synaphobranchus kaupii]
MDESALKSHMKGEKHKTAVARAGATSNSYLFFLRNNPRSGSSNSNTTRPTGGGGNASRLLRDPEQWML